MVHKFDMSKDLPIDSSDDWGICPSTMLPTYREAALLLGLLDGVPRNIVTKTIASLYLYSGSPAEQMTWRSPSRWIETLLEGEQRDFAYHIWIKSNETLNPRYIKGAHLFLNKHMLLDLAPDGKYEVSVLGDLFRKQDQEFLLKIDYIEGMLHILELASHSYDRQFILSRWVDLITNSGRNKSVKNIKKNLFGHRLANLSERMLIIQNRGQIRIQPLAIDYLSFGVESGHIIRKHAELRNNLVISR